MNASRHCFTGDGTCQTTASKSYDENILWNLDLNILTPKQDWNTLLSTTDINASTDPIMSMNSIGGNDNDRNFFEIKNSSGQTRFQFSTINNGNPELRFNVVGNTRLGFPKNDPTYFAFINDYSEFWLGNQADPTLYFNYYTGANEMHGSNGVLQNVTYWSDEFTIKRAGAANPNIGFRFLFPSEGNNYISWDMGTTTTGIQLNSNKAFSFRDNDLNIRSSADGVLDYSADDYHIFHGDVNVGAKTMIRQDGNIYMTSPNGANWNCGVTNSGTFQCSTP